MFSSLSPNHEMGMVSSWSFYTTVCFKTGSDNAHCDPVQNFYLLADVK